MSSSALRQRVSCIRQLNGRMGEGGWFGGRERGLVLCLSRIMGPIPFALAVPGGYQSMYSIPRTVHAQVLFRRTGIDRSALLLLSWITFRDMSSFLRIL